MSTDSLGFLLNQAVLTLNGRLDRALAPNLTGAQWTVVFLLHEHRASTASDLARALSTDVAAAWRLVGRLVDKGYVARRADPTDRRAIGLSLTPTAMTAYPGWRGHRRQHPRPRRRPAPDRLVSPTTALGTIDVGEHNPGG